MSARNRAIKRDALAHQAELDRIVTGPRGEHHATEIIGINVVRTTSIVRASTCWIDLSVPLPEAS